MIFPLLVIESFEFAFSVSTPQFKQYDNIVLECIYTCHFGLLFNNLKNYLTILKSLSLYRILFELILLPL